MSLKALHIVFVASSTLLLAGIGLWQLVGYFGGAGTLSLLWGLCAFGVAVLLVIYGVNFLKKLKKISML
ncbi:MAG: hypothetical protein HKN13_14020 [Rhodothermales bacterium]|nr:hypothetical protein [Rhodothermales bacterium]